MLVEIKRISKMEMTVVSSLDVAETFEKRHADVLRDIEELGCSKDFRERNFALSKYLIENNMLNNDCIVMVEELKEVVFKPFEQLNLIKKNDYGITALNVFKYQE